MFATKTQQAALSIRFIQIWSAHNLCRDIPDYYVDGLCICDCLDQKQATDLAEEMGVKILFFVDQLIAPLSFIAAFLAPEVEDEIINLRCNEETTFDDAVDDVLTGGDWTPVENVIYKRNVDILDAEVLASYVLPSDLVDAETAAHAARGVELIRRHELGHFIWSIEGARELGRLYTPAMEGSWPEWAFLTFAKEIMVADPTCPLQVTSYLGKEASGARMEAKWGEFGQIKERFQDEGERKEAENELFERIDALDEAVQRLAEEIRF